LYVKQTKKTVLTDTAKSKYKQSSINGKYQKLIQFEKQNKKTKQKKKWHNIKSDARILKKNNNTPKILFGLWLLINDFDSHSIFRD